MATTTIRRSAEEWQAIIQQQTDSGLSARQYCEQQQISYFGFCRWRRKLSSSDNSAPTSNLIEVSGLVGGAAPVSQAWDVELELGNGMVLRVRR